MVDDELPLAVPTEVAFRLEARREKVATMDKTPHTLAIEAALAADWTRAHEIVQELNDPLACWIHGILHKMEGDAANSRYWYGRAGDRRYEDYADTRSELEAALASAGKTHQRR
jgi:hypothetical protein